MSLHWNNINQFFASYPCYANLFFILETGLVTFNNTKLMENFTSLVDVHHIHTYIRF